MTKHLVSFLSGVLFALGLAVGGMLEPARVVGFLDFFGIWDPTLAFLMAGGVGVNTLAYYFTKQREAPALADRFHLPDKNEITARLIGGSVLFGVGWALAGYCPGPAVTTLASGTFSAFAFVGAMAAGMYVWAAIESRMRPKQQGDEQNTRVATS